MLCRYVRSWPIADGQNGLGYKAVARLAVKSLLGVVDVTVPSILLTVMNEEHVRSAIDDCHKPRPRSRQQ